MSSSSSARSFIVRTAELIDLFCFCAIFSVFDLKVFVDHCSILIRHTEILLQRKTSTSFLWLNEIRSILLWNIRKKLCNHLLANKFRDNANSDSFSRWSIDLLTEKSEDWNEIEFINRTEHFLWKLTAMELVPTKIHNEKWKCSVCSNLSIRFSDGKKRRKLEIGCKDFSPTRCDRPRIRKDNDSRWCLNFRFLT